MSGHSYSLPYYAWSKARHRILSILLSKIFKPLFSIIYVIIAVEFLFRIMAPVAMMPRYVTAAPYGVRCNMPNKTYRHKTAEYEIIIKTNLRGIRSDYEIPYERHTNKKRVLILGDSFGMGYGVNADDMFTSRMAHYLKDRYGYEIEVVNLSTSGHGNAEQLITLLNEGFKYEPDLVLLAWHDTDLKDNVRSNLFKYTNQGLVPYKENYLPAIKERRFLNQLTIFRFLSENSQIYNFVRNWSAIKIKNWLFKFRFRRSAHADNVGADGAKSKQKQSYETELTLAILNKIKTECQQRQCGFLILDIPFRKTRTEFISKFPQSASGTDSIEVVSPISKFQEHRGEQLYWEKGDIHFTPLGCDIVGSVLADRIYQKNLLRIQK
jgi:hypothetical protein